MHILFALGPNVDIRIPVFWAFDQVSSISGSEVMARKKHLPQLLNQKC